MLKTLVAGAALALIATSALAEDKPAPPSLDQQLEQAQSQLYAAEAQRNLLYAKKFQAALAEAAQREAAKDAWWASYVKGLSPAPAAEPQK
jgi:hypothetical protein